MRALDFIKTELQNFILQFPKTKAKVESDEDISSYYLEIIPNEIYHFDENYIEWENSFLNRFISAYPQENIFFITDDSIITIETSCFEIVGTLFKPVPNFSSDFTIFNFTPQINILNTKLYDAIPNFNEFGIAVHLNNYVNLVSNSQSTLIAQVDYLGKPINDNPEPEFENSFTLAA